MRWWAFWRRVQYSILFLCTTGILGVAMFFVFVQKEPTCSDGIMNGGELGVDCGGSCRLLCESQITQPVVLWAESFKIIDGQYNAVAYIENSNKAFGTPELTYTLTLSDAKGVIAKRTGRTVLPPESKYPVFEGRIQTGERIPTKTELVIDPGMSWYPGEAGREQFKLEKRELVNADSKPRLTAQLSNTSNDEAQNVEIVATIFNSARKPLTAARTVVEYFPGKSTQDVVFTWPEPIAKTLRSCEVPTDVVLAIDLSGSMNSDSIDPPEPLTSVLTAADAFVDSLRDTDQIGLVTYATKASTNETLTNDQARVRSVIQALRIDPKEETGSTNTGDALKRITEELSSERHSQDARKVAVILTDGLATAPGEDPEGYARTEAAALKAQDITLFTIGLGAGAKDSFLQEIASAKENYYKAPTTDELAKIYAAITESICEDGPSVIEIIPKAASSVVE